jgi:hypothetical protein
MKWISVNDRLPYAEHIHVDNPAEYLVCRSDGVVQTSPAFTVFGFADIRGGKETFVTHWMPLPAPPVICDTLETPGGKLPYGGASE